MSQENRFTYIDVVRGIGIILVVFSHSTKPELMYWANGFFMPLFFVLSGFLDKTDRDNFSLLESVKKKGKRLLIPYFFWCIIILVITKNSSSLSLDDFVGILYSRAAFFKKGFDDNVLFLDYYIRPLWFLTSLFTSYIMYYLILLTNNKDRGYIIVCYVVIAIGVKYLPILLPWCIDISFLGALFIFAGRLIRINKGLILNCSYKQILILFIVYLLLHYINGNENLSMSNMGRLAAFSLICGVTATYALTCLVWRVNRYNTESPMILVGGAENVLRWIGKNSLAILCIHLPLLSMIGALMKDCLECDNDVIISICQAIVSILIGGAISHLVRMIFPLAIGERRK